MIKRFGYFKGESVEYKNIKVLGKVGNKTNFTCDCPKCGGKGKIDIFNYIDDGICFKFLLLIIGILVILRYVILMIVKKKLMKRLEFIERKRQELCNRNSKSKSRGSDSKWI